jgi:hypothetical protein
MGLAAGGGDRRIVPPNANAVLDPPMACWEQA